MPKQHSRRSMAEILCIGDSCADIIFPYDKKERVIRCGGAAANTACALGKLNVSTSFVGKAGNDLYGKKMKEELDRSNVDTSFFILDEKLSSTLIQITIDENGERHPILLNADDPSYLKIYPKDLDTIDLTDTKYILTNGMMLFRQAAASSILSFLKKAKQKNIRIVLDINFRTETIDQDRSIINEVIEISDILLGSTEDDYLKPYDCKTIDEVIEKLYKKDRIIVSHDPKGSDVFFNDERYHSDSYTVEVADSIGAGDNFNAGFLYGLIHHKTLKECNELACATAAYSLQKEGARYTPDETKLYNLMKRN